MGLKKSSWKWVVLVRQIDKPAARLSAEAAAVLMALAMHADPDGRCHPGQDRLCRMTGVSVRNIQRVLAKGIPGVAVKRRRQASSVYELSAAILAGLPQIENRQPGGTTDGKTRQNGVLDPPNSTSRPARLAAETRQVGGQKGSEKGSKNGSEEEGAPAAPASVRSSEGEIGEEEAFALADEIARRYERPAPTRGSKSRDAMGELLAVARAMGWKFGSSHEALRLRLEAHYARDDQELRRCAWALKLAFQVEPEASAQVPLARPRLSKREALELELAQKHALMAEPPQVDVAGDVDPLGRKAPDERGIVVTTAPLPARYLNDDEAATKRRADLARLEAMRAELEPAGGRAR